MSQAINYTYARGIVYELTMLQSPKNFSTLTPEQTNFRHEKFCSLFGKKYAGNIAKIDQDCKRLLTICTRKWHPPSSRMEYFDATTWLKLNKKLQKKHTLSRCTTCEEFYRPA